jgi:hypothetical protein
MKQLILFLILIFGVSCAQNKIHSQQQPLPTQEVLTPTVTPTPFSFPKLPVSESSRLDERLPKKARSVLEQAEQIELFELKFNMQCLSPELEPIQANKFQGCDYTKKAVITDVSLKKQILDGLFYAVGSSDSGAMCFTPRHGLRAIYKDKRVELIICFQCGNFRGASSVGRVGGGMSSAWKELFEQVLANSKEK